MKPEAGRGQEELAGHYPLLRVSAVVGFYGRRRRNPYMELDATTCMDGAGTAWNDPTLCFGAIMQYLLQTLRIIPCARFRQGFMMPVAKQVRLDLGRGDYARVDLSLASLPAEHLDRLIWDLAPRRDASRLARQWMDAAPDSRHAGLLAAHAEIARAWKVRGETYAEHIPLRRRRKYPEIMARGHQQLLQIVDRDPGNAMALAGLIHCSVVIGVGEDNRGRWLNQALEAAPFHYPALRQYARGTLERWGGAEQERYHFAGWVAEHAPAGHCAHVLVADTMIDDAFISNDSGADVRLLARYLGNAELAQWVRQALYKWLQAESATLQQRLAQVVASDINGFSMVCVERFALAAYLAGAKDEARMLFTVLQGRLQDWEWEYFIPEGPVWWRWLGVDRKIMRVVHDNVCRDLQLDPRQIVRSAVQ